MQSYLEVSELFEYFNDVCLFLQLLSALSEPFIERAWLTAAQPARNHFSKVFNYVLRQTRHHFDEAISSEELIVFEHGRALPFADPLKLEQPWNKIVLDHIVVPESHKQSNATDKHALNTTNVWNPIQNSVAISCNDLLTEVHLNSEIKLHIFALFVGNGRVSVEHKRPIFFQYSQIVQIGELILQEKLSRL